MKKRQMMASRAEKFTRFGIRKCSLGAVSVAIATGLAFLGSGAVQADQLAPSQTADSVAVSQAVENQASTAATPTVTETSLSSMDRAAPAPEAVSPAASQISTSSDTSAQYTSSDPVENAQPKSDVVASTENQPAVAENSEKSDASNQPAQPASAAEHPLAAAEVKKPQGKITIQNNNPQTGEFDIVVSDIIAPDGLKSVYLPTWSAANDQDDVQWYTAERRADGTYFKHVSYRNHKNSLGEYNVHLYFVNDAGQLQGAGSAKTVVSRAQPQGKITIQNNNPQTGEFDIVVSDIVAPDGLKSVSLPTWSIANDQDDVQWYTAERRADGTYFKHVSYRNHKNSLGEYNVHLYFVNDAGQLQGAGSAKTVVTRAQPQGKITIQNNNPQTGEFDIVVSDIVAPDGLKSVSLPTWSTANDQDDVQWYTAERRADGTYFKHVSYRNHKNSLGEYNVHLYFVNDAGQLQGAGSAKTVVNRAQPQGKITIQNNNPQTGEFDIVVSDIVAPDGLKAVYLPTWSAANDQDDVQWYTAERRVDGTYFKHVSYRNHKNSLGEYNVHLYFVNDAGQLQGAGSTKTVVTRAQPQGKITIQNNNPQTGEFDIIVSDIVAPDGLKAVYLPTWSAANDQDDVQWYTAERQADGTYKKHVRAQDHKFSVGEYKVHLYYLNEDGQMQGAGGEKLMVSVAPENIRATGKINIQNNNARTGTFDVVVTNVSNPGGIQAVYLPTWSTDKDQDDVKWYLAQKQANGTYKITVRASDHKLSTGEYKIHLYYKQDNGQLIAVDATTTQVSKAVYNTPYYSQRDVRWGGRKYGPYSMDATGCVPTTLAMVISGITGTEVLPTTVADYLYNNTNEFNKDGFGTSSRGIVRAAQHWDLTTETLFTASAVKEVLSQGHHVLGAVGTSIFAHYPVTHELVLKGYDNGKTYVRDPYNAANNGWYPVDYLFGVKSVDPTDNTEGSPFIAIKG